jgi:hypothetical protein
MVLTWLRQLQAASYMLASRTVFAATRCRDRAEMHRHTLTIGRARDIRYTA